MGLGEFKCGIDYGLKDSSAVAILARHNDSLSVLDAFCTAVNISLQPTIDKMLAGMITRKVHAKRARLLRRRGIDVWFIGKTSTGKSIYGWIRHDWWIV